MAFKDRSFRQHIAAFLKRGVLVLGVLVVVGAIIVALWKVPEWQVPDDTKLTVKERLELRDKHRGTLAQMLGGCVLLFGLYLTYRRITAIERTVEVAQEGQLTERFTRAIEQLGSEKIEVRLGGIYALERIAKDSPRDHWTIMEVLTAYIRERASWKDDLQSQEESPTATGDKKPPADIQAILTVIGRRKRWYRHGEEERLNLSATDLRGANLWGAHLEGVNLWGAHLEGANLWGAVLSEAYLVGTDLRGAHLEGTDLRNTGLKREQLAYAFPDDATILDEDEFPAYLDETQE